MDIKKFKELPIMGILRGIEDKAVGPLTEAIISSGLKTVEITMNTQGASSLIKKMRAAADDRLMLGAGTVLNMGDLKVALDAGATFIVLPVLVEDVVKHCKNNNIPVFPGAFSPQEIYRAWSAGATMVKVFPAKFFGPAYFKEIKAPFNDIELLACGGVNKENIAEFFKSGASAAAFGGSIFKKDLIEASKYSEIKETITSLINAYTSISR